LTGLSSILAGNDVESYIYLLNISVLGVHGVYDYEYTNVYS